MFPSERAILMDIATNKDSNKQLANRPMDVVSEYISYLCDSLVRRGYLTRNGVKGYTLTSMGREPLLEFINQNEDRV
jgi:predicted transcriptional regulator